MNLLYLQEVFFATSANRRFRLRWRGGISAKIPVLELRIFNDSAGIRSKNTMHLGKLFLAIIFSAIVCCTISRNSMLQSIYLCSCLGIFFPFSPIFTAKPLVFEVCCLKVSVSPQIHKRNIAPQGWPSLPHCLNNS